MPESPDYETRLALAEEDWLSARDAVHELKQELRRAEVDARAFEKEYRLLKDEPRRKAQRAKDLKSSLLLRLNGKLLVVMGVWEGRTFYRKVGVRPQTYCLPYFRNDELGDVPFLAVYRMCLKHKGLQCVALLDSEERRGADLLAADKAAKKNAGGLPTGG